MNQPPPPLPFGWSAQWDPVTGTNTFIENATGRSQSHFPGQPSFAPNPRISSPPNQQQQQQQQQSGPNSRQGSHPIGGHMSPPPFSPQLPSAAGRPSPAGMAGYRGPQEQPHQQQQQQQQQQPEGPAAPGPARGTRRQYAANTAAYIAGEPAIPSAPLPGHGHQASLSQGQFFSPAANDPSASPYIQSGPTFGAVGNGVGGGYQDQLSQQGQAPVGYPGQQQGQAPMGQVPYGGPQGGQGGNLATQFGQMGLGAAKPAPVTPGVNLIALPLSPAELFSLEPPEIRLPQNASFSNSETRNCDPSYQRSTINAVPTTSSLLTKSKLPLALVITPYRSIKPGDAPVPVVSDTVIARCRRCRTYINPYVTFIEGGHRWKCCMCNLSNETPQLFDWDQENNQPTDRYLRPELNNAVVEFVAPTEYMVRPPQPPIYIFIIDVSHSAINSGMVATAARTLLESLDRIPNDDSRTKISIIAVDSCLHFFSLPAGATEPTMMVVGDLEDVFLPKPSDILVNIVEARAAIESLLARLNDMFKDTHNVGSALGAALQAAFKLVSHVGGKVLVLTSTLPNLGPGALKMREDSKLFGTPKESTLLQPQNNFYKNFAIECSRSQVSVDMWLFSSTYTDVATLSGLPRYTGGQTYLYPSFNAARSEDALKFAHEFGTVVADPIALEAVMRVRASKGIRMSSFHGNFFVRSTDLLSLAAVPMDQSYAIEIQIEDPISAPFVVFQTAVLHTTCYGERRIRVITLALPTTTSMSELYSSVDTVAMATLLTDKAVERSMGSKLEDARDAVSNKLVDILGTYKANMTSTGSGASPALAICENMKFLPLLMLGLLKHVGIRQSAVIPSDFRSYAQALLTTLPSQLLIPYLHPVFYSLHNMPKECGTIGDYGVVLPIPLNLSAERLERHGLFLMEDGQNIFLWVGRDAVPQLVMDVFDIQSYAELRAGKQTLPVLENSFSQRINAIIGKVREARRGPYYAHLFVVKEDGEPSLRQWALSTLIEDRMDSLPSYGQWLGTLKDKVNDKNF